MRLQAVGNIEYYTVYAFTLCDNGIVNVRKEGKWSHYSYSDNIDITLINMISSIFTSQEDKQ